MKPKLPLPEALLEAHQKSFLPLLERFQKNKTLHPSLLITGLEGVGKKEWALYFLQSIFCDATTDFLQLRPCGHCKSCLRSLQDQWLDLYWIEPETNEDETRIGQHKIDTFRELKSKLGMGPIEEPFKVVVITEAERMTTQAANSILKMLEEPPPLWLFILTAADSSRLLPTILSRCIEVRLNPLSASQIFNVLKNEKASDFQSLRAEVAAKAGQGSLIRARYFMDEDSWQTRSIILGLLSSPTHEWMKLVEHFSKSQRDMILGLDLLESLFTDLLNSKIQGENADWIHRDQKEFLSQWMSTKKISSKKLIHLLSEIAEKRRYTQLTLNSKLLAQEVLIPLLELIL